MLIKCRGDDVITPQCPLQNQVAVVDMSVFPAVNYFCFPQLLFCVRFYNTWFFTNFSKEPFTILSPTWLNKSDNLSIPCYFLREMDPLVTSVLSIQSALGALRICCSCQSLCHHSENSFCHLSSLLDPYLLDSILSSFLNYYLILLQHILQYLSERECPFQGFAFLKTSLFYLHT